MGATVGTTGILIKLAAAFNPNEVDATEKCVFFSPTSGNMTTSNDANCDKVSFVERQ